MIWPGSREPPNRPTERGQERSAEAARQLLERSLTSTTGCRPCLMWEQSGRLWSHYARRQCASPMGSVRRGMRTDLYLIGDIQVRDRYRTLVKLAYDIGWRGIGREHRNRQIRDVASCGLFAPHRLRAAQMALVDGVPMLVEVKRATDSRIRREAVGQLRDYAANGARRWLAALLRWFFDEPHTADGRLWETEQCCGSVHRCTWEWGRWDGSAPRCCPVDRGAKIRSRLPNGSQEGPRNESGA